MTIEICLYIYAVSIVISLSAQLYYKFTSCYSVTVGELIKVISGSMFPFINILLFFHYATDICDYRLNHVIWKKKK